MPALHNSIILSKARIIAVPVSIEPSRPSPIVNETIFAPGATPSNSVRPDVVLWLPAAIEATCVPWLAVYKNKNEIKTKNYLKLIEYSQHIPTISNTFPSS